jgi:VRR-NUC domain
MPPGDTPRAGRLHISPYVHNREKVRNRVRYSLQEDGSGKERGVSERVVLSRWKKRPHDQYRFAGFRLRPNFWREQAVAGNAHFEIILKAIGQDKVRSLISRHRAKGAERQFGVPDLFLYAVDRKTGSISHARFVEVKRPDEKIRSDQHEEIMFLLGLELRAGVFRLREVPASKKLTRRTKKTP